ncbi:MAG: DUF5714 domain-containing protein [Candidatus Thorarchaeota archaeon]|jgi:hypothetical protein
MVEENLDCLVCGTKLVYDMSDKEQICVYCGGKEESPIYCPNGHFVCDTCHSKDAIGFLEKLAEVDKSTDPMVVADNALSHPSFKFHGPEHHSLIPAAVLIAMKNRGITRPDGSPITNDVILEGIRRGSKIPGGYCGYAGTCGACVGAGVTVALFVGSTPTKGPERKMAHKATSTALFLSQDGLRRCCKRATYYGMKAALDLLKNEYDIDLGEPPELKSCKYSSNSRDCEEEYCPYYKGNSS